MEAASAALRIPLFILPPRSGNWDAPTLLPLAGGPPGEPRVVTPLLRRVHRVPQLLHLERLELPARAELEPFERQPGVGRAVESRDRVADGGEHPFDLMLASLVQDELDATAGKAARPRRCSRAVVELDPVAQPLQRLFVRVALDLGDVDLLDAVARMGEPVRQLPVVREQQ